MGNMDNLFKAPLLRFFFKKQNFMFYKILELRNGFQEKICKINKKVEYFFMF